MNGHDIPLPADINEDASLLLLKERESIIDMLRERRITSVFQNIYINAETKKYLVVSDETESRSDLHPGYWADNGYVLLCDAQKSEAMANWYMKWFYPQFEPLKLEMVPIHFREACDFITKHHRHHVSPVGHKYSLACTDGSSVVGVITVGRPVSRHRQDGKTLEVTRCCALPGFRNICSLLLGRARRIAQSMGYQKMITYTLNEEDGASLKAAGFECVGESPGGSWNSSARRRNDKHPTGPKKVWSCAL